MPLKEQMHTTLNIGMMFFRARPAAIEFVNTFYDEMVNDPAFGTGNAEWDQSRFNRMVREGSSLGPREKPWIEGWGRRVKVQALDIVEVPNGRVPPVPYNSSPVNRPWRHARASALLDVGAAHERGRRRAAARGGHICRNVP